MPEKMGGYDRNGWVVFTGISIIRPIQNKILSEYLFAYLSSYTVQSVIEDKSDGSTKQKELTTSTVKN